MLAYHHFSTLPTFLTVALAFLPASTQAQGCPVAPGDFVRTKIDGIQLEEPMELDIDAEENIYWIERKTGALHVYDPRTRTAVKAGSLNTYANGPGKSGNHSLGVIGLALAPDFAASRKLYLQYTPVPVGGRNINRVSRFTMVGKRLDLASEEVILEFEVDFTCCHQAGSLEFGPDGSLYIATGDNYNTRPNTAADWEVPYKTSMNPQNRNGKILRILPNRGPGGGYTIPKGNLFQDSASGKPEIYVMGARNPYRLNADPRTGWLYWGDVGPDGPRMEEINQNRNEPGNFGWPAVIGFNDPTPSNGAYAALRERLPDLKVPLIAFNTAEAKAQSGAANTAGIDLRGRAGWTGPVYYYNGKSPSRTKFPPSLHGTLLLYDWHLGWINSVHFNGSGHVASISPLATFTWAHMIDMKFSPSGELYVLDYGTGYRVNNSDDGLYRIHYNPSDPAACLPAAPELDSKTIANAGSLSLDPMSGRGSGRRSDFAVVAKGGADYVDLAGLLGGRAAQGEIHIRDLSGRRAGTVPFRSGDGNLVPLPSLDPGVYVLDIRTPALLASRKAFLSGR